MSNNDNQAVRGFYQLTETIKTQFLDSIYLYWLWIW